MKKYLFKKGSKIHIKESQKGSFTKYCNGKVTNECIQKGKNSSDPKIRKKAVFAENSRKWAKKAEDGTKLNFGTKVQNFVNSDIGQLGISAIQNIYSGIAGGIKQAKQQKQLMKNYNYLPRFCLDAK